MAFDRLVVSKQVRVSSNISLNLIPIDNLLIDQHMPHKLLIIDHHSVMEKFFESRPAGPLLP